jgi:hypothetical protein
MPSCPPISPDLLRKFLRDHVSAERLQRIATADRTDGSDNVQQFIHNLETGSLTLSSGNGNPYECALMQRHDLTAEHPLNELFGAWWLGVFCSDHQNFVLIDNLAPFGVGSLLHMVVRGCGELGKDAHAAAAAAVPCVRVLQSRTRHADRTVFRKAIAALEEIERVGPAALRSLRYQEFIEEFN